MKVNPDYVMRKIAGECVIIPTGQAAEQFNGMISLNETGAFLWEALAEERTMSELVELMTSEFEVEEPLAALDVETFVRQMKQQGLLCNANE